MADEVDPSKIVKVVHPNEMKHNPICPISGSKQPAFLQPLSQQVTKALWYGDCKGNEGKERAQAAMIAMMGIAPKDEMEGMLAAQMVGLHHAAMECMRRAMLSNQTAAGEALYLNQANKLTRSYALLMETLDRHRGKRPSEQKVTVEHVHIHAGGQAIVGNVNHSPTVGGGVQPEKENQPHAKHITHAPEPTMPCQNPQGQPVPIPCDA